MLGPRDRRPAPSIFGSRSNVVHNQAGYLARPTTTAPETQFYFITHGSGAFPGLRQRTVARGERASRSIVNRTTAFWSISIVASLILAGPGFESLCLQTHGREIVESRGSNGGARRTANLSNMSSFGGMPPSACVAGSASARRREKVRTIAGDEINVGVGQCESYQTSEAPQ